MGSSIKLFGSWKNLKTCTYIIYLNLAGGDYNLQLTWNMKTAKQMENLKQITTNVFMI